MTTDAAPSQENIDAFVGSAHGDAATVRDLLARYPGIVNLPASWGETAIGAAAQTGQIEIAEMLLAAGAPLTIGAAAMLGRQADVAAMLPGEPGGANAAGAHGLPVLYHAVVGGHMAIAEMLLASGADPNGSAPGGTSVLHGAVMFDRPAMVRWLLARGADPDRPNGEGQSPRQVAEARGLEAVRQALGAGA